MNRLVLLSLATLLTTPVARAQESTNVPAATMPGQGSFYLREKVSAVKMSGSSPRHLGNKDVYTASTSLWYGITRDIALGFEVPVTYYDPSFEHKRFTQTGLGFADMPLTFKWRPLKHDIGPLSTIMFAINGGIELPSGYDGYSSNSFDPFVGAALTVVADRHGFNQSVSYKFQGDADWFLYARRAGDGDADALRFDTSYLYRLHPSEFSKTANAGTYLQVEFNGLYETNGDLEMLMGVGLLYEAPKWAVEATVAAPVGANARQRQEADIVFTIGFRYLF
jgi:hypothetical protein